MDYYYCQIGLGIEMDIECIFIYEQYYCLVSYGFFNVMYEEYYVGI